MVKQCFVVHVSSLCLVEILTSMFLTMHQGVADTRVISLRFMAIWNCFVPGHDLGSASSIRESLVKNSPWNRLHHMCVQREAACIRRQCQSSIPLHSGHTYRVLVRSSSSSSNNWNDRWGQHQAIYCVLASPFCSRPGLCYRRAMLIHGAHPPFLQCVPSGMRKQNRWARAFLASRRTVAEQLAIRKVVSSVKAS